ncbi:hypothetical protein SAMN05880582_108122 [Rhizobium sp. RU20A]|uniref:D-apionate lactonase n=1 Tax=Rhizobium sp. RU20A TaxID=1907412 RepID=UPI000955EFDD|nr:hypothetical protein [Rhizobium sp. RU20A]SIR24107.1 hypothetical protein SAMN05880582_108122 [Rhizobium sp. RU20A]
MLTEDARFRLYGTSEPLPASRLLSAGPLLARLQDGNLRTIRFAGHEVLRGVSFLIRDKDWGTCAPEISDLSVSEDASAFAVRYKARFVAPDGAELVCRAEIKGLASGRLTFSARFSSNRDFQTARAGFTVLHPLKGVVGEPVEIRHVDGSVESARWPDAIEPWQPFMDISAITHGVAPGLKAETRFEGDVFEMEDQRNWTDGSYKTYVRPLALPWPYLVPAGEEVFQNVTLTVTGQAEESGAAAAAWPVRIALGPSGATMPAMGLGLRPECLEAERAALPVLARLGISELVAHFDPLAGHGLDALRGYAEIASASGLPVTLELALPCRSSPAKELREIAALCRETGFTPSTLLVSPAVDRQSTPPGSAWPACPPLENIYEAARSAFPGTRLGGGMMSYFTELNRKRVPAEHLDYVSHCTNPIVHAADDLSVMQSFEALKDVVRSVRAIYPDKPYRIGPSTIAMRQNPYGSATKDNPGLGRIPMANVDPRHNGQFGAAFAAAYAATVAPAGVELLTLATLAGPFGLVAGQHEPSAPNMPRPLAAVIGALSAMAGEAVLAAESDQPDAVLGVATPARLLIVNITAEPQQVLLPEGYGSGRTAELGPFETLLLEQMPHA